ncbi:hypothetical protein SPHINGO8BC_110294 [Sphingobacterium multivorum]|uniref:Uncharacterized protein n=1 Tax=Sphingobacterium multivorum TaxID=28454 RepID=A0A653YW28_SPHMU|nr:hypothetical protein SPHINGO8BC_110294 [Sphingobacterium multivorum]
MSPDIFLLADKIDGFPLMNAPYRYRKNKDWSKLNHINFLTFNNQIRSIF